MGHKVEAREVKIAAIVTLVCAFLIKGGTALASYIFVHHSNLDWSVKPSAWLNNPGYHGFSEMLYQYTSATANNGSGFEGLADNNLHSGISQPALLCCWQDLSRSSGLWLSGDCWQTKNLFPNLQEP